MPSCNWQLVKWCWVNEWPGFNKAHTLQRGRVRSVELHGLTVHNTVNDRQQWHWSYTTTLSTSITALQMLISVHFILYCKDHYSKLFYYSIGYISRISQLECLFNCSTECVCMNSLAVTPNRPTLMLNNWRIKATFHAYYSRADALHVPLSLA